jgi:hypothetical protein
MKKIVFIILGSVLFVMIVLQFFPVKKSINQSIPTSDFISVSVTSPEVGKLIKNACYDCHSYETVYPWYFKIAPVSWIINSHISEARDHLNFSDWGSNSKDEQNDILKACLEEINNNEMPLFSYKIMHPLSRFREQDKTLINNWIISFISNNNDLQEDTFEN